MNNYLEEIFYPKIIYKKHPNTQKILEYALNILGSQEAIGDIIGVTQKTVSGWINNGSSLDKEKIMPLIRALYPKRYGERYFFNVIDLITIDIDKFKEDFEKMVNQNINLKYFGINTNWLKDKLKDIRESKNYYYRKMKKAQNSKNRYYDYNNEKNKEIQKDIDRYQYLYNKFVNEEKEFYNKNNDYKILWKLKNYDLINSLNEEEYVDSYNEFVNKEKKDYYDRNYNYKNLWKLKNYDLIHSLDEKKYSLKEKSVKLKNDLEEFQKSIRIQYDKNIQSQKEYNEKINIYNIEINKIKLDKGWSQTPKSIQDKLINQIEKVEDVKYSFFREYKQKLENILTKYDKKLVLDNFNKKSWDEQYKLLIEKINIYIENSTIFKNEEIQILKEEKKISTQEDEFKKEFYPNFKSIKRLNNNNFETEEQFLYELNKLMPKNLKNHYDYIKLILENKLLTIKSKKVGFVGDNVDEFILNNILYRIFTLNNNKIVIVETKMKIIMEERIIEGAKIRKSLINYDEERIIKGVKIKKGKCGTEIEKDEIKEKNEYGIIKDEVDLLKENHKEYFYDYKRRYIYYSRDIYENNYFNDNSLIPIIFELKKIKEAISKNKTITTKYKNLFNISKIWDPKLPNDLIKIFKEEIIKNNEIYRLLSFYEKEKIIKNNKYNKFLNNSYDKNHENLEREREKEIDNIIENLKELFFNLGYEIDDIEMLFE